MTGAGGAEPTAAAPATAGPLADLLAPLLARGGSAYLGEPVTQLAHGLQAADLAAAAGAPDALVAAALLHDVGWLLGAGALADDGGSRAAGAPGDGHAAWSARYLARWLPPAVTEPVRLHVAAKRWLCATSPAYHDRLSEASRRTLVLQGGPLTPAERDAFEAEPWAPDAVHLRRWDDEAKVPDRPVPDLASWCPLLAGLVGAGG